MASLCAGTSISAPQAQALMDALRRHFTELAAQPFAPTFLAGQTQKVDSQGCPPTQEGHVPQGRLEDGLAYDAS